MTKAELTAENEELRTRIDAANDGIMILKAYLTSDKFAVDPTVQTRDVLNRMESIGNAINGL